MKTSFRFLTGGHLYFRQTFPLFKYVTKGRENYCVTWRSLHSRKHTLYGDHVGRPSVGDSVSGSKQFVGFSWKSVWELGLTISKHACVREILGFHRGVVKSPILSGTRWSCITSPKTTEFKRDFCENRYSDNHTLLRVVNEFLPVLFTLLGRFG